MKRLGSEYFRKNHRARKLNVKYKYANYQQFVGLTPHDVFDIFIFDHSINNPLQIIFIIVICERKYKYLLRPRPIVFMKPTFILQNMFP